MKVAQCTAIDRDLKQKVASESAGIWGKPKDGSQSLASDGSAV
jgi:hypothetical protein